MPTGDFDIKYVAHLARLHLTPDEEIKLGAQLGDIFVEKDGEKINGKSIMGLMMLAAGPGSKLTVHAQGADAAAAISEIESLIKRKFDED